MRQPVTMLVMALAMVAVLTACQPGSTSGEGNTNGAANSTTTKVDKKVSVDEIRAVLAQHDKALNEKNLDAVLATFSSDPKTVVLGTGAEERWVGTTEIKAAYTEMFKDYDPNTMQVSCDWKTGGADDTGAMAWLAAICAAKDSKEGKAREYKLNVSAAMEKQDGKWRFLMLHMSNAFEPPVTK